MMIIFAIPVKSKAVSADFSTVLSNLDRTLRSIANQTDSSYEAFVVTNDFHEVKQITRKYERVSVLEFPYERNEDLLNPGHHDMDEKRIFLGLFLRDRKHTPFWVMTLDADDLVHESLVDFINNSKRDTDWIISGGYILDLENSNLTRTRAFQTKSGSRCIFRVESGDLPEGQGQGPDDSFYSLVIREQTAKILRQLGREVKTISWPAALYVRGHEESISRDFRTKRDKQAQVALLPRKDRWKRIVEKVFWRLVEVFTNANVKNIEKKTRILAEFGA